MGISSARPDDLDSFARRVHHADHALASLVHELTARYREFESENEWGVLEAGSLLSAFREYLDWNDFTVRCVAGIAEAFRKAGGDGKLVRLPDRAIKASLRGAGLDHHRGSVTFDAPVAYGFPETSGYADDPINTATGNFVIREEDLVCGRVVVGLSIARTYNSRSGRVGPFGRGWSSWATARLVPRPDGVAYVGPDGQEARFPRMGAGFDRVIGVDALVEPLASGLALCWFDGRRWEFDEAGLPVSLAHGPGTEIRLRHGTDGRLVELTHPGGKRVRLEWDGERIVELECSDGRRVSYRYDASDNLVEADGSGGTRRYELDDAGRVVSITDGDGVVELVNTYDEDGRVLEQLSPFGRRTYVSYLPGRVTVTTDDDEDGPINTYIHDAAGRLLAVVDGEDRQLSMVYDQCGNVVALTERNGAVTVQEYDERARPVRRVLPTGATFTFAYDEADRLVEAALSTGGVARYRYEGDERSPVEIVDPEGGVTRQVVRDGLVRRVVDPDGVAMDFAHDADGNIAAATDGGGNVARIERDAAGRVTGAVTPLGRRVALFYDGRGRMVERHDPRGGVWRYEYSAAGRLLSATDPTGAREEIRYGEHGLAAATVDAIGHVTAREYDVFGNVVGVVEPDGARWKLGYDALMRLTETVDPVGACWQRAYDAGGTLVGTLDPAGVGVTAATDAVGRVISICDSATAVTYEYDELGRIVAEGRPDGSRVRAGYDLCGRLTMVEDATGAITRMQYTPAGRLARRVFPSGRVELYEHDARGQVSARIDGAGRRWEYSHDADGAVAETRLPTGEVERFEYDPSGSLTRASVPGGGAREYGYDAVGRLVAVSDREAGARTFERDAAGRVVAVVDANGGVTGYEYNERGWLTQISEPLGGTVTQRHDAAGRLVEHVDQLGRRTTSAYDLAGRLVEQVEPSGRGVRMGYDGSGRLTSIAADGEEPTRLVYDALGRVVEFEEPGSFSSTLRWDAEGRLVERGRDELAVRWRYTVDGERAGVGYPDGTETTYAHDAGGFVVAMRHPGLGVIELRRDAVGRLVGASGDGMRARWWYEGGELARYEMHAGATQRTAQLMRDALGRVTNAVVDGAAHRFWYDAAGQLVSAQTAAGVFSFGYDANGRLVHEASPAGTVDYEYDAAGQLLSRVGADGAVTRYEYDADGRRVRESGPGLERGWSWDGLGRLTGVERVAAGGGGALSTSVGVDALGELAMLDGRSLLWDSAHPLEPLLWDGEDAVVGEGSPWGLAGAGAARWLAPDWQGTVGDAARDPWGATPAPEPGGWRLGYRGEIEFDSEVWLRNRVYQPATRAFGQPDPLAPAVGTASAANPYHYAANNPVGLSDPLGLRPVTDNELKAIRDHMGRGLAEKAVDGALGISGTVSAATSVAALVCAPIPGLQGVAAGLGTVSAVTGVLAGVNEGVRGDEVGAAVDIVGSAVGFAGVKAARSAMRMTKDVKTLQGSARAGVLRDSPGDRFLRAQEVRNTEQRLAHTEHVGRSEDFTAAGIATSHSGQETLHKQHEAEEIDHEKDRLKALIDPVELRPAHIRPSRP
jgi:RHS repeat-associated protein